ncbi:MAG: hypothetical protein HZA07_05810, partial [Nitrospirae bacterium]|nr:hypothetical protein [Nitrospirota bacterium]
LWEKLLNLSRSHDIEWKWIRGHDGYAENERCDKLARLAIKRCKKKMLINPNNADIVQKFI